MNKQTVLIFAALFLLFASSVFAASPEASQVSSVLKQRTNGNDAFLNKLLSPAKSLDVSKNDSDRVQKINDQISNEVSVVVAAFNSAKSDSKITAVGEAINKIDPNVIKSGGAFISFIEKNPSSATARIVLLIPKKTISVTAKNVFNVLTSYKRSAKPSDVVYEYASAENLTSGTMKTRIGSETSYLLPAAAGPLALSKNYVLKKCRQLLGWRCVTSFYRADQYLKAPSLFFNLFVSIVDLAANPDHSDFASDKRSVNQVTGSTGVYIVKEDVNWVLLYGNDSQWNDGPASFTNVIQKEFQKDFLRLKARIAADLKIQETDLK
jgi:hypothetical protein